MKKILLIILTVIILIFAYSEYREYQRFHPKNANIQIADTIDLNYHNQETVYHYFEAVEAANNFMQMQWSANGIDVRSPKSDDEETAIAIKAYQERVAKVNYYKSILEASEPLKNKGLKNNNIKDSKTKRSASVGNKGKHDALHMELLLEMIPRRAIKTGDKSMFIYELQKLLVKNGHNIPIDGVYLGVTSVAIKRFEEKNNLYADGKIDGITLLALMH